MRARGWCVREGGRGAGAHLVDPVDVGRHAGVDCGLLVGVAAQPRAKAHDAPHLPGAVLSLAVQWASRVPLHHTGQASVPRPPPEAGLGSKGESGWGMWVPLSLGTPCFGLSQSTVREAEKRWFGAILASC